MFALIAILIPSLIGLKIIEYFFKEFNLKDYIYYYLVLLLFTSILNCIVAYSIFHLEANIFYHLNWLPIYFCKYSLISIFVNVLFAFFIVVIVKNISCKIEVLKSEKNFSSSRKKHKKIFKK